MKIERDFESYYQRMGKNIKEKTDFIISELNIRSYDVVFDFGCANGTLTKELSKLFPNITFYGYDFKTVIEKNTTDELKNLFFVNKIKDEFFKGKRYAVIFSSVIHELSYLYFYKLITEKFKTANAIMIRDMYSVAKTLDRIKIQDKIAKKLYKNNYKAEIFENYFFIDWNLIDDIIEEIGMINIVDYGYKNDWLLNEINEPNIMFTHRKKIYTKPLNHY